MVASGVAYIREGTAFVAEVAAIGEHGAATQYGVASAIQLTGFHIKGSVGLQCVTRANDVYAIEGDALAVDQETFGLTGEVGSHREVFHHDVRTVVEHEGGTA